MRYFRIAPILRSSIVSKHDVLTEEEFATYIPNQNIIRNLHNFAHASGRPLDELRVLDWGCGRGRDVLWLRQQGYEAFGIDIDPMPIENSLPLFQRKGISTDCLALLDNHGRSPYPDGFFDYVFSGNVLEHIADIRTVCAEMARVTRRGGRGYHVFPSHRHPIEGHLFMPFVHWLPPGQLRKLLILVFILLGREPNWIEVRGSSVFTKAEFYFQYTVNNTFYRPYSTVRHAFEECGFSVTFMTIDHPRIRANPLISRLIKHDLFRRLLNRTLLTFKLVEMQAEKE